jgi:hypothetical protein
MAVNLRALNRRGFASSLDPAFCLAAVQIFVQRPFLLPAGFNAFRAYAVQRAAACLTLTRSGGAAMLT